MQKRLILLILTFIFINIGYSQIPSNNEGYITINDDLKLHYRIIGAGSDTIVVPDVGSYYPYFKEAKSKHTFIVYDVRDRAYSDAVKDPSLIGMDYEISDLENVRKFFNLSKMNLIGSSYLGGLVALYCAKYPNNVLSLVLVDPIPFTRGEHWKAFSNGVAKNRNPLLVKKVDSLRLAGVMETDPVYFCKEYQKSVLVSFLSNKELVNKIVDKYPCDCENEWPQNMGRGTIGSLGNYDWSNSISTINVRTLIMHGTDDPIPVESSSEWASLIKDSRLLLFHSSGHMPVIEESEIFFKAVNQFINGKWPKKSTVIQK